MNKIKRSQFQPKLPINCLGAPILKLPDEILVQIFTYCKGWWSIHHSLNILSDTQQQQKDIENIRLSCWRFHDTSSHLLIHYARVELNLASLEQLDKISSHPLIRKGVKGVRFVLSCYSSLLADNIHTFAPYALDHLISKHNDIVQDASDLPDAEPWPQHLHDVIRLGIFMVDSWQMLIDRSVTMDREIIDQQVNLLNKYEEYKKRFEEQESLRKNDLFLRTIGLIIRKLPIASIFELQDSDRGITRGRHYSNWFYSDDEIIEDMLLPHQWKEDIILPRDVPMEILFRLPGFLHRAGIPISSIYYNLLCDDKNPIMPSEEDLQDISQAVQSLKKLGISCSKGSDDATWPMPFHSHQMQTSSRFISAHLATNNIQELHINLQIYFDWGAPPPFSILSALNLHSYPHLTALRLNFVTLDLLDLRQLFDPILVALKTLRLWNICLLSGTWREALDIIRTKAAKKTVLEHLSGVNYESLSNEVRSSVFHTRLIVIPSIPRTASKAEAYVGGHIAENPLELKSTAVEIAAVGLV